MAGLAIHPRVADTRLIYLAQLGSGSQPILRIVRYRNTGDILGERAVLFEQGLASRPSRIRLRVDLKDRLYAALLDGEADANALGAARPHQFLIRLMADGRMPRENAAGSVFAEAMATRPIDLAWPADGSLPVVVEQTARETYRIVPANPGAPGQGPSFSTTSTPVSAEFASRDGAPALWLALGNGELLSLEQGAAGWTKSAHRPMDMLRRASNDAAFIGDDQLAFCGPATATDTPSAYGMWRLRLRH
ncbi:MAG: hypothetical protein ABIQ52_19820 [Vicinamibacterales bacterium]